MRASQIKAGDIIQAGHGPGAWTGRVLERQRGWLHCVHICHRQRRRIRATDVVTLWRKIEPRS